MIDETVVDGDTVDCTAHEIPFDPDCGKEVAAFTEYNMPMPPELDDDCKFLPKQCSVDDNVCYCVDPVHGAILYDRISFPNVDDADPAINPHGFDCTSE